MHQHGPPIVDAPLPHRGEKHWGSVHQKLRFNMIQRIPGHWGGGKRVSMGGLSTSSMESLGLIVL